MSKTRVFGREPERLARWYAGVSRVLPWRSEPTPYRVWVSEIMLQQTQVVAVVPYFERFVGRFPDVKSLARAGEEEVLAAWAGLGYYSRARNLLKAAREVVARGGFPGDREAWLELPGVGPYTAGAIVSIAYDLPEPILDGNVERVLSRLRRVGRQGGDAPYKAKLWRLARAFVETGFGRGLRPSVVNQALMELGATVCVPAAPRCADCPLAGSCQARAAGEVKAYPPPRAPKKWLEVRERVHCLIDRRGWVLLRRSSEGQWRAGLWDFPSERPRGRRVALGEVTTRHVVTRHRIERVTCVARVAGRCVRRGGGRWVDPRNPGVPVGSAWRKAVTAVLRAWPDLCPAGTGSAVLD